MGNGTDVAIQSSTVTLVKGDLRGIIKAIKLSRATVKNMRQNLVFAFLYNALGVPIAAGLLYPCHVSGRGGDVVLNWQLEDFVDGTSDSR